MLPIEAKELPRFDRPGALRPPRSLRSQPRRGQVVRDPGRRRPHPTGLFRVVRARRALLDHRHAQTRSRLLQVARLRGARGCHERQLRRSTSHLFRAEPQRLGARHIAAPPYTPRWNSKVAALDTNGSGEAQQDVGTATHCEAGRAVAQHEAAPLPVATGRETRPSRRSSSRRAPAKAARPAGRARCQQEPNAEPVSGSEKCTT